MGLPDTKGFCVIPWAQQIVSSSGNIEVCCMFSDPAGRVETMEQDWNGDFIKSIRKDMASGERSPHCSNCWIKEDAGQRSLRQSYNESFVRSNPAIQDVVARSLENEFHVDEPPVFIELRFGNLCNLMCKMCNGGSSSQIVKDSKRLQKIDPEGFDQHIPSEARFFDMPYNWHEDPEMWKYINSIIPHLTRIHVTGGEPTLIKENIAFFQACIDAGCAGNIEISLCTNMTTVNNAFIWAISQFKAVHLTASLDGVGAINDYIRYPSDWAMLEANFLKLIDATRDISIHFHINFLLQAFNMLDLDHIFDAFIAFYQTHVPRVSWGTISLTPIVYPVRFRLDRQPASITREALQRWDAWIDSGKHTTEVLNQFFTPGTFDMIRSQLTADAGVPAKIHLDLYNYVKFIDQNKTVSAKDALPTYYTMLKIAADKETPNGL